MEAAKARRPGPLQGAEERLRHVSALVLACGDARTKQVYLTTRQAAVREEVEPELFQVRPELRLLWVVPIGRAQLAQGKAEAQLGRVLRTGKLTTIKNFGRGPIFRFGRRIDFSLRWMLDVYKVKL